MVEYHWDMCDKIIGTMQRKIPGIASMFACTHGMHRTLDVGLCWATWDSESELRKRCFEANPINLQGAVAL